MMKKSLTVLIILLFCFISLNLSAPPAYSCGDTDPGVVGSLKLQGYSLVEDLDLAELLAPWIAANHCAEVLTILLENDFEILDVSGIQGPPGVVYTLVRGRPDFSQGTPPIPVTPGVAVIKCGKAGPHAGDDGGCSDTGGDSGGGCDSGI
jgi:hypothetical protein